MHQEARPVVDQAAVKRRCRDQKLVWLATGAIAVIAAIGVLAIGWSSLWIVFVWVCCFAFPVLGEFKNRVNDEKWELPKSFGTDPRAEWEYREAAADWRHRDGLTWQMPTVMVSLVGLVMSQIYRESFVPDPEWIRVVILVMFAAMSGGLVVTLKQNLVLQDHSRQIMQSISEATARFGFTRVGSNFLYRMMVLVWILLTVAAVIETVLCLKLFGPT